MTINKDISTCILDSELEDYVKNNLSQVERNRIEQHCSFCEMCSDSLEGLQLLEGKSILETSKEKLALPKNGKTRNLFPYYSAAAGLLIIFGVSYFFISKNKEQGMAALEKTTNHNFENILPELSKNTILKDSFKSEIQERKSEEKDGTTISLKEKKASPEINNSVKYTPIESKTSIEKKANQKGKAEIIEEDLQEIAIESKAIKMPETLDDAKFTPHRKMTAENERPILVNESEKNALSKTVEVGAATNICCGDNVTINSAAPINASPSFNGTSQNFSATLNSPTNAITLQEITVSKNNKKPKNLDSKINSRASEEIKIKAAKSFIQKSEFQKAIGQLDRIIKSNSHSDFYEEALWLKALCLKRLGKAVESKTLILEIINKKNQFSKMASDSLNLWNK